MFSINGLLMSALTTTPVAMISSKSFLRVSKMRAPCLMSDMLVQALTSASMSKSTLLLTFRNLNFRDSLPSWAWAPMVNKNRLISGWKMMMSAMKPTLTKAPRMAVNISICKNLTSCQMRKMATMPMKMLMAEVPFSRRYSPKNKAATRMMSMMSKTRICMNRSIMVQILLQNYKKSLPIRWLRVHFSRRGHARCRPR